MSNPRPRPHRHVRDGGTSGPGGRVAIVTMAPEAAPAQRLVAALTSRGGAADAVRPHTLPGLRTELRAAVCRLPSGLPQAELLPLLGCERAGLAFLNRPSRVRLAHDKLAVLDTLRAAGLAVPPTVAVVRDAPARLDALPGERFVVKPWFGASGHGVTLGLTRDEARRRADAFAEASGPALVQPLLGDGTDVRLFVVGGEIVAAMQRRPRRPGGRGSLLYGAVAHPHEPDPRQVTAALTAAEALGLDIVGVDLLLDPDAPGPVVLEANSCPGLTGIEAATGLDVAGRIADLVMKRVRSR